MFGRVRDKYCNEPITCRYYVKSIVELLLYNLVDLVVESGVTISFAFYMFVFDSISWIYFFWDRKNPKDMNITSTPKK